MGAGCSRSCKSCCDGCSKSCKRCCCHCCGGETDTGVVDNTPEAAVEVEGRLGNLDASPPPRSAQKEKVSGCCGGSTVIERPENEREAPAGVIEPVIAVAEVREDGEIEPMAIVAGVGEDGSIEPKAVVTNAGGDGGVGPQAPIAEGVSDTGPADPAATEEKEQPKNDTKGGGGGWSSCCSGSAVVDQVSENEGPATGVEHVPRDLSEFEPNFKLQVCRDMCDAACRVNFEDSKAMAAEYGLEAKQGWHSLHDEGNKAVAIRGVVEGENVLIVAFRSTFGMDEWLEYPKALAPPTFLPHAGFQKSQQHDEDGRTDDPQHVFRVWEQTVEEFWEQPGDVVAGGTDDTVRGIIWRQLNSGGQVWLTGHSKGGAIATTASSRLVFGDSVDDAVLADPTVRRPPSEIVDATDGSSPLSKVSVLTFSAPKAFTRPVAEAYTAKMVAVQAEHMRFTNKADALRDMPPLPIMIHVGQQQEYGEQLVNGKRVLLSGVALLVGGPVIGVVGVATYFGQKLNRAHCG
ncbi:unnamed protein product [Ectocarpus sp. 4 AP-2014]